MATAASGYRTPPHDGLATHPRSSAKGTVNKFQLATPTSVKLESPGPETPIHIVPNSAPRTQKEVDPSPTVKRLQQDLLILTGFNDNSSLHWRPAWFVEGCAKGTMWTLHNPPNVVTEPLPNDGKGMQMYTRRMRRRNDPPPLYIKDWDHWARYCGIYGIPHDFLNEDQVRLMRMALPTNVNGSIHTPPQYPLYPEPSSQGSYVLAQSVCSTHLPRKFQQVASRGEARAGRKRSASCLDCPPGSSKFVIVESDGKLSVVAQEDCTSYPAAGKSYRWSYFPWTTEMEKSCRPLKLKVRFWNEVRESKKARLSG